MGKNAGSYLRMVRPREKRNVEVLFKTVKAVTLLTMLLLSANLRAQTPEAAEEKGVDFTYIPFPIYDYRPMFEHTLAMYNKFLWEFDGGDVFNTDLYLAKSLSNQSWTANVRNFYNTENWRFELNNENTLFINELSADDSGVNAAVNSSYADISSAFAPTPLASLAPPQTFDLGKADNSTFMTGLKASVDRRVMRNLFIGAGIEGQYMKYTLEMGDYSDPDLTSTVENIVANPMVPDDTKAKVSPLLDMGSDVILENMLILPSISATYDSRNDLFYPTEGIYFSYGTQFVTDALSPKLEKFDESGSVVEVKDYFFTRHLVDLKAYYAPFDSWKTVLAGHAIAGGSYGDEEDIPVSMHLNANYVVRGYEDADFSGLQVYNCELELRQYLTERFGMVAFGSVGFIGNSFKSSFKADNCVPAGGLGIRFMFAEEEKLALRADFGFGRDGEKSFYFGISEFF